MYKSVLKYGISTVYTDANDKWRQKIEAMKRQMHKTIRILLTFNIYIAAVKTFRILTLKGINFHTHYSIMASRYLDRYLARSFNAHHRGDCLINHYAFLNMYISPETLDNIIKNTLPIWEYATSHDFLSIFLSIPYYTCEGDLCLTFCVGSIPIYDLSFTIVQRKTIYFTEDCYNDNVIFITRVQGMYGTYNLIRMVTQHFEYVSPSEILFIAVQAIAAALGVKYIAGITSKEQIASGYLEAADKHFNCYDGLWDKVGGKKVNELAFLLPTIPQCKSPSQVKAKHRQRKRRKREFQNSVYYSILNSFQQSNCPGL